MDEPRTDRHVAQRHGDGSAGDADYGSIAQQYDDYRRPDPRIADLLRRELGAARSVLNVGAGAGSYEPIDLDVTAVEPSASMRARRPADLAVAIDATAEDLPFEDDSFDAALTTFSVHQWSDVDAGLAELRRVTRGPVVVLTCDPSLVEQFWLTEYVPGVLAAEARRYPTVERLTAGLGPRSNVHPVAVPLDCSDGFNEAYYGRPEMFLDPSARSSCSAWSFVEPVEADAGVERLRDDLTSGAWDARHGDLRRQPSWVGSLVVVTGLA